jgi:hypothetical protein
MRGWHASFGLELHQLQVQIATRGLALLKVGGMMTYSTCSFNPVEDEAVVHELVSKGNGAIEIVDVSAYLPGLVRRPGWHTWQVFDDDEACYPTYEDVPEEEISRFNRSMFPPAQQSAIPLERCMRIHPEDQNTGGFFICLLRKVRGLPGPNPPPSLPIVAEKSVEVGTLPQKFDHLSNFKISLSLRTHLSEQGGSRFNVVYMGQRQKKDPAKKAVQEKVEVKEAQAEKAKAGEKKREGGKKSEKKERKGK